MKKIYYLCFIIGLFIAFYAQYGKQSNTYVLVLGIALLMFGLYNISKVLSSKKEDSNFIKTEFDEEE